MDCDVWYYFYGAKKRYLFFFVLFSVTYVQFSFRSFVQLSKIVFAFFVLTVVSGLVVLARTSPSFTTGSRLFHDFFCRKDFFVVKQS